MSFSLKLWVGYFRCTQLKMARPLTNLELRPEFEALKVPLSLTLGES